MSYSNQVDTPQTDTLTMSGNIGQKDPQTDPNSQCHSNMDTTGQCHSNVNASEFDDQQRHDLGEQLRGLEDERSILIDSIQHLLPHFNQAGSDASRAQNKLKILADHVASYGPIIQQLRERNQNGTMPVKDVQVHVRKAHENLGWIRNIGLPRLCGHNVSSDAPKEERMKNVTA